MKPRKERGTYIGGHDAARIVGSFPYGAGAADTYAAIVHKRKVPMNPKMLRGLLMEPGLSAWVAEQRRVPHARDVFLHDSRVPFFGGTADGIEEGGEVLHEFTTTTTNSAHLWGVPGTDDCAKHKWIQTQWYMGIMPSLRVAHVWCYVMDGDEDPLHYVVPRNEVAIGELRRQSEAFWYEHIIPRIPPLSGVHGADAYDVLDACYPNALGPVVDADKTMIELATAYATARGMEKIAETTKKKLGAQIKALLAEHVGAKWEGGSVSWQARAIGEKTNWENIAHEVAMKLGADGVWFNGLVRENTFPAKSVRGLRVNVRGVQQPKFEGEE